MFSVGLSDVQLAICDLAGALGDDVVAGHARQAEVDAGVDHELWSTLVETGLVAPVPQAHGGGGIPDALSHQLTIEGLAHGDAAIAASVTWSGNAAVLIGRAGTPEQQAALLPSFAHDPSCRGAVAMYEGFGRAPSEYETTIVPVGSGRWQVTGTKVAVAGGSQADPLVVVGVDPTAGGALRAVVLTAGRMPRPAEPPSAHLGLGAVRLETMSFDQTCGPEQLLGGPDADPTVLARALCALRLTVASLALGCGRRACEYAAEYAKDRVAFGRPIASFQGVSFLVADGHMQLDAAQMQSWRVATEIDHAEPEALERATSEAVNYATSVAASVTRDAIQVLGGHGFITDHPVERWYRAAGGLAAIDCDPTCSVFAPAL